MSRSFTAPGAPTGRVGLLEVNQLCKVATCQVATVVHSWMRTGAVLSSNSFSSRSASSFHTCQGTQQHSAALSSTQQHSEALRGTQRALSGTQRAPGPRLPAPSSVARRRRAARARARLLRHRRAHLPVPFAADDPRSAALVLRVPAPQYGETPADCAAKYNGNAEVKAFFASGQVRPICVQSEGTQRSSEGTQRALRGHQRHSVAIRGLSEASQRHAEAIRGDQRAVRGTHRPSEGTQRPSLAIIRNQQHSGALGGNQEGAGTQDGHDGHIAC
jgi:hypothetical protein